MRVPFSWLKEFAPVSAAPEEVASRLRHVGVPVARVEFLSQGITNVWAGEIVELKAHPDADKLRIAQVNLGNETLQIVTGASNVAQGDIVPIAKLGAALAGGKVIAQAKLRGVASFGMMCSGAELDLDLKEILPPAQQEGVLILDAETPVGSDLGELLGLSEAVFVLEPFANRPDFLSVFGVAREVAALYGVSLRLPKLYDSPKTSLKDKIEISVEDPQGCSRYVVRLISNVNVGRSPLWMAVRLRAAGIRPVNNLVDITNYVLLELGQPLHAFDYHELSERTLRIRRAHPGEKLVGIDGKTYSLTPETLVIADRKNPVAIAGVMGGKSTEISEKTREVLLESAHFAPELIRRTSLKLGIRTESSRRFEKGLDPVGADWGSRRACHLFAELGAKVSDVGTDIHEKLPESLEIRVSLTRVKELLGVTELEGSDMEKMLCGLGFEIRAANPLVVSAPLFRNDIKEEVDLVEEVARHYGYDRIPTVLPCGATTVAKINLNERFENAVRQFLKNCGLDEVITYSLGDPGYYGRFSSIPLALIENPLTEDRKALRPMLYPEMLAAVKRNLYVKNRELAFFEIGRVFEKRQEIIETRRAAVVMTGKLPWGKEASFFTGKGLLEGLWKELRLRDPLMLKAAKDPNFHPLRMASVGTRENHFGFLGEVHPQVLESMDIDQPAVVMELDLDPLQSMQIEPKFNPIPAFPESRRDVSMVVNETVPVGEIQSHIWKLGSKLTEDVRIFDVYQGPQIPTGKKSIAFAILYRASDRTLTDEEVNALHSKILSQLEKTFDAKLRI